MRIIQLTDLHLFDSHNLALHGHTTHDGLKRVIDFIVFNNGLGCDAVLVTGDISQDGSLASYYLALQQLERIGLPIVYIHGNHDNKQHMDTVFTRSTLVRPIIELASDTWQLITVDTVQGGDDSGWVTSEEKNRIEQEIIKYKGKNIALIMHHHPVPVGTPLVDDCMLRNGSEIVAICHAHDRVKALICGHAHRDYSQMANQCLIDVCPATCFQWLKGTKTIRAEDKQGFKLLAFADNYGSTVCYV
ncbi:metallophosphoesterase [Sodalis sp. RH21]|uniref:metallophosphoesterase n=1 Tax=unclassified Sodalis (in: enterobacteria) TaxID=2636512 RepID=UPI0039B50592